MTNNYIIEIYENGDSAISGIYESDKPFLSMNIGEKINALSLNETDYKKDVIIKNIEHMFFEHNNCITHKICVDVEALEK